jgi:branched-chain amino acid transport system ATP-binding protein
MTGFLDVVKLTHSFGGLRAVNDVSFSLKRGTITALVGPNGAGKTTCFNLIAGAMKAVSGEIVFEGRAIAGLPPETICRLGVGRTFQIVRPMPDMSVIENAMVGAFSWTTHVREARAAAYEALENVGLAEKADMSIDKLTLPDRKMLETANALSTRPKLLLLDEVMAGLRPTEAVRVVAVLRRLVERGLTILLVEHVMRIVMEAAENVIVLHHGAKIAEGRPQQVVHDPRVLESYLGPGFHG